jgi:ABC-type Fe2+-enterobactin transport system substrate-binding protein
MPRPRLGALPMTPAERQARRRAKLGQHGPASAMPPAPRTLLAARRPLPRPQRWAAAVSALIALQDEYRVWLDNLPESLEGSRTAEKRHAITEIDLDELRAIDPPRGYGRD